MRESCVEHSNAFGRASIFLILASGGSANCGLRIRKRPLSKQMPVMRHASDILTMSIADSDQLPSRYTHTVTITQALLLAPNMPLELPYFFPLPINPVSRLGTFSSETAPGAIPFTYLCLNHLPANRARASGCAKKISKSLSVHSYFLASSHQFIRQALGSRQDSRRSSGIIESGLVACRIRYRVFPLSIQFAVSGHWCSLSCHLCFQLSTSDCSFDNLT